MSGAREEILERIRERLGRGGAAIGGAAAARADDAARTATEGREGAAGQAAAAGLRPASPATREALLDRFVARSVALSTTVERLARRADVPAAVQRYLVARGLPTVGAAWPALADLDWAAAGIRLRFGAATGDDTLGITGSYCALAETGTLVLLSGAETAASTSLLPETHIAVVMADRVVMHLEEAFALIRAETGELPRAVNLVSGPSRTGDIEQTIVLGAHGPYRVHVLLVDATYRG